MRHVIAITTMFLCTVVPSRQAVAQTPESQVSADWKALGWTLPESFSPDQIAFFKGLNAARGTWSFEAETVVEDAATTVAGKLVITGGSQGGMASAWNMTWSWPAENPQHAIYENIMAMPEKKPTIRSDAVPLWAREIFRGSTQAEAKGSTHYVYGTMGCRKTDRQLDPAALARKTGQSGGHEGGCTGTGI